MLAFQRFMDFINRPSGETDCVYETKVVNFDTALTDFNSRQFKTWMKKMAAQVDFFCFLMYFSVWLAIWSLKISTFVLIKVLLTYLLNKKAAEVISNQSVQGMDPFFLLMREITQNNHFPRRFSLATTLFSVLHLRIEQPSTPLFLEHGRMSSKLWTIVWWR